MRRPKMNIVIEMKCKRCDASLDTDAMDLIWCNGRNILSIPVCSVCSDEQKVSSFKEGFLKGKDHESKWREKVSKEVDKVRDLLYIHQNREVKK
jgi:hypothetical protein